MTFRRGWALIELLLLQALLLPVRLYRAILSPVMPPACRFHPSCSKYALDALTTHGPFHGGSLAARRLMRCHPFHPGGLDPVPPPRAVSFSSARTRNG